VIEKLSKLLQFYNKSSFVDDALLMIGKAFYYQQDYIKAHRKFTELITTFPESDLVSDAMLWSGKTLMRQNKFEEGIQALLQVREKAVEADENDIIIETYIQQIAYLIEVENYPEAINTYKMVFEKYPDKKEAKQSLFMVAFIYDETMKDKENAKTYYKKFIEKYPADTDPNDKMTESAKRMLEVLESGKSIEELILQNSGENKTTETKTDIKQEPKKDEKKTEVKKTQSVDDANLDKAPEQKKK
jgi:outer membrane protein assembly factor BamD (BamD/ComL family)